MGMLPLHFIPSLWRYTNSHIRTKEGEAMCGDGPYLAKNKSTLEFRDFSILRTGCLGIRAPRQNPESTEHTQ